MESASCRSAEFQHARSPTQSTAGTNEQSRGALYLHRELHCHRMAGDRLTEAFVPLRLETAGGDACVCTPDTADRHHAVGMRRLRVSSYSLLSDHDNVIDAARNALCTQTTERST